MDGKLLSSCGDRRTVPLFPLQPFKDEPTSEWNGVTWERSDLREWLNNDFYKGLPADVNLRVLTTQVFTDNHPENGYDDDGNTDDKVFILSAEEANRYFVTDDDHRALTSNLTNETVEAYESQVSRERIT